MNPPRKGYCAECTKLLEPDGPHEDFCSQGCQRQWMAKDSNPLYTPPPAVYGGPAWYVRD